MIGDKLTILLICTILLLILWNVPANGVTQEWARTYDATGVSDEAKDIAVDSSGNVYVTGWAGALSGSEYMTIKYDSAGNQLWATPYDGPQLNGNDGAAAIAVDSSGNCYVTGWSPSNTGNGEDIVTVKYNSLGVQQWASRYDNVGGNDQGSDIAVDSSGNVYVTGFADNGQMSLDIVTIKYNSGGVQQWARLYDGGLANLDAGLVIGVTGGSIYVGGYCTAVAIQAKDYVILKYNAAGTMQAGWPVKYNGTGGGDDIIRDLRVDSSGNVYVTGDSRGLSNKDCVTIKYNSAGVQQWLDRYDNGMDDAGQAIVLDASGNVYAAGYSQNNPATKTEFLTRKINNAGVVQWTQRYDGTVGVGSSVLVDVAVDNQSPANVYITGNSSAGGSWDYTTIMYDSLGNQKWAITYDPTGQSDEPRAIAVYDVNDIYVTGYTGGDFGTVKYSQRTQSEPAVGQHLKWSQPPVEINPLAPTKTFCGWDEKSFNWDTQNPNGPLKVVADDFRCLGTMPVTSIHWWGSYYGWEQGPGLPPVVPTMWWIGFWSNAPAGVVTSYSYPNVLLHSFMVPAQRVQVNRVGTDQYYNSYPYDTCYEYNLQLQPNEVFKQNDFNDVTFDHTYWISVIGVYPTEQPYYPWGWKTRPWHWMDDAVTFNLAGMPGVGYINNPFAVVPLVDPVFQESVDVSFELDTDPNYIKWEQDFTGIRDWPLYEDVNSVFDPHQSVQTIVADDWKCTRRTPITAAVWWGSYIGYNYQACSQTFMPLPVPPDRFCLKIWTDVPANDPCNPLGFSYPGNQVWEYMTNKYDEVMVGYDKDPQGAAHEPVFRYSVRLPEDKWFKQPNYEAIYWLSVQAVYDVNQPNYQWGWTNHQHVFNDNAVQFRGGTGPGPLWTWHEVFDHMGQSADMSFMLFTDPNVCSTCANYNCDAYVNFLDYADFADDWYWVGPSGGYNNADLNCNGTVDLEDLRIFCAQWLTYCP